MKCQILTPLFSTTKKGSSIRFQTPNPFFASIHLSQAFQQLFQADFADLSIFRPFIGLPERIDRFRGSAAPLSIDGSIVEAFGFECSLDGLRDMRGSMPLAEYRSKIAFHLKMWAVRRLAPICPWLKSILFHYRNDNLRIFIRSIPDGFPFADWNYIHRLFQAMNTIKCPSDLRHAGTRICRRYSCRKTLCPRASLSVEIVLSLSCSISLDHKWIDTFCLDLRQRRRKHDLFNFFVFLH